MNLTTKLSDKSTMYIDLDTCKSVSEGKRNPLRWESLIVREARYVRDDDLNKLAECMSYEGILALPMNMPRQVRYRSVYEYEPGKPICFISTICKKLMGGRTVVEVKTDKIAQ